MKNLEYRSNQTAFLMLTRDAEKAADALRALVLKGGIGVPLGKLSDELDWATGRGGYATDREL